MAQPKQSDNFLKKIIPSKDQGHFSSNWFKAPLRTGAVAPSSKALARTMVAAATLKEGQKVLELGPGTGVVTQALIEAGVPEENIVMVELSADFTKLLTKRFPKATLLNEDAIAVVDRLADTARGDYSTVISSLPLLVFPKDKRTLLRQRALDLVGQEGQMVQFTYGGKSPLPEEPHIEQTPSKRIWFNLPPATVWTYALRA